MLGASSFVQFCRQPGVQATRLSWDELDNLPKTVNSRPTVPIPDLSGKAFEAILKGQGDWPHLQALSTSNELREFINECYTPDRLA
jgi:hypothetical protein